MNPSYLNVMTRIEILRRLNDNDRDLQMRNSQQGNYTLQRQSEQEQQYLQRRLRVNELQNRVNRMFGIQGNSINIENRNQEQYKPCGKDCSICLEKVRNDGCKTSCNHHFHKNCINSWKNVGKNTCPNCRSKL